MSNQKRNKRVRKARQAFPKRIAAWARKVAAVMTSRGLSTAHYVFDGSAGQGMVLVTIDPQVTQAIRAVLEAMHYQETPADEDESPAPVDASNAPSGGLASVALTDVDLKGD